MSQKSNFNLQQTAGLAELSVKTPDGFLSPALTMNKEMSPSPNHDISSRRSSTSNHSEAYIHTQFTKEDVLALPADAVERFDLFEEIGQGTYGLVHRAIDVVSKRQVAIKIVENIEENIEEVLQEYQILTDHSLHPNIPQLYGAFRCGPHIWFSLELCDAGPASELARQLVKRGRRLIDDQIAYIIKEVLHALIYLQESHCIHRDVKGSNILLNKQGEVRLVDFGISCQLGNAEERRRTRVGTPYWMAPEVILAGDPDVIVEYDGRCDVWSLGITIIELAEGAPPLHNLHPMRALMQIPKNPPPRLSHPEEWGLALHDIVTETLIKDYDQRPMLQEIIEHPLFKSIPQNPTYIQHGLCMLMKWVDKEKLNKADEFGTAIHKELKHKTLNDVDMIKTENIVNSHEYMQSKKIAETLQKRREAKLAFTYVGDLLIAVSPEYQDFTEIPKFEPNEPHIVAESENAFNRMNHEKKNQLLLIYGYSSSGIGYTYSMALNTLCKLGSEERFEVKNTHDKVLGGDFILQMLTSRNLNQGKSAFRVTKLCFNSSGCLSGAQFDTFFQDGLTNFRTAVNDLAVFRTVIIGLRMQGRIREFGLHHFLSEEDMPDMLLKETLSNYTKFIKSLQLLGFRTETGIHMILRVLVAIQLIGKLTFEREGDIHQVVNTDVLETIANLLELDAEFLVRAITQTNVMTDGKFFHCQEPQINSVAFAGVLYSRLLDWVEDYINGHLKLSIAIHGFKHSITITEFPSIAEKTGVVSDDFGTLLANCTNEIIHWLVIKLTIKLEEIEARQNRIKLQYPNVKDNRATLDSLLSDSGFFSILNECSSQMCSFDLDLGKQYLGAKYVSSPDCHLESNTLKINHFWSQTKYNTSGMFERNENFVNPEIIQTMTSSSDECLRNLFQFSLNKFGKVDFDDNGETVGYSQTLAQQTIIIRYRHWIEELMKLIANTRMSIIFCFDNNANLGEQVEAFNIKEFAYVRKKGFPHRLPFAEFLRQYCFLGFEFDERVVATKDNAQLLMLRLAIDGFECGKRKIFLKYYHINYLSNIFNSQYRKIVVIQSTVRRYLAKRRAEREKTSKLASKMMMVKRITNKWKRYKSTVPKGNTRIRKPDTKFSTLQKNKAALEIQRHFRGFSVRQKLGVKARYDLLKILSSVDPGRKEEAEEILKEEGLNIHQAKAAVAEIEKAIKGHQTQAIITQEEMFKIFSGKVFTDNLDIQLSLKKNKESSNIETIQPVPSNFRLKKMAPEDFIEIQKLNKGHNDMFLPPIKLYDMANFYTDKGPSDPWDFHIDALVYELGCKITHDIGHVIKERTTENVRAPSKDNESPRQENDRSIKVLSASSKMKKSMPKAPPAKIQMKASATYHGGLDTAALHGPPSDMLTPGAISRTASTAGSTAISRAVSPTVSRARSPASTSRAKSPVATRAKSPVSNRKTFQPAAETKQMNTNIVHQLNMLKKSASTHGELSQEDGPFDFRSLLRRTDQLPTDTLRRCRVRNLPVLHAEVAESCVMSLESNEISL